MPEKKQKNRKMGGTINTSAGTTIKRSGKREVQNFCALLSSFCFLVVSCYRYRRQATIGHKALKTLTDCHQRIWTNRIWRFQFFFSLNQVNCIFVDFFFIRWENPHCHRGGSWRNWSNRRQERTILSQSYLPRRIDRRWRVNRCCYRVFIVGGLQRWTHKPGQTSR